MNLVTIFSFCDTKPFFFSFVILFNSRRLSKTKYMKKLGLLLGLLAVFISASISYSEVHFKDLAFKDALKEASKGHKIIMVDLYTDWCGWCKRLDRDTYSDDNVGKYADENFVSLKMNAEQGEGIDLAKNYQVRGYPTILFFNEKGEEIHRLVGYQTALKFKETLEAAVHKNTIAVPATTINKNTN